MKQIVIEAAKELAQKWAQSTEGKEKMSVDYGKRFIIKIKGNMKKNNENKPKVVREIGINDIKDAKIRETFRKANEFLAKCLDVGL